MTDSHASCVAKVKLFKKIILEPEIQKNLLKDRKVIAVMGKFNAGKSTFMNTLLSSNLLPKGEVPTTAIPVYVYPHHSLPVYYLGAVNKKAIEISMEEFQMVVQKENNPTETQGETFQDVVEALYVGTSFDKLPESWRNKVAFLDTEGEGADDDSASWETSAKKILCRCDLLLWIVDIADGRLAKDSKKELEELRKHVPIPMVVVLNKAELLSSGERVKIQEEFSRNLEGIPNVSKNILLFTREKDEPNFQRYQKEIIEEVNQWIQN